MYLRGMMGIIERSAKERKRSYRPKRQKNLARTYILQAAQYSTRIAQKKPGRKGILEGNYKSKPKAKTNSSEQAWNYNPGFFFGDVL